MVANEDLCRMFMEALPPECQAQRLDKAQLGKLLETIWTRVTTASPHWITSPGFFLAYVAERIREESDIAAALGNLHVEDLALAADVGRGRREALRFFEERVLREVDVVLQRQGLSRIDRQEMRQVLFTKLCVGLPGHPPRITQYAGKGTLRAWVRVVAVREAQPVRDKNERMQLEDEDILAQVAQSGGDHEIAYWKARYGHEIKTSMTAAMATLSPRERTILRHYVIDGLNIDRIAALHQVHRATAARWLESAREHILKETRRDLMERLGMNRSEFESIARFVQSELDVSLARLLPADESPLT